MERFGYISYAETIAASQNPLAWAFGSKGKKLATPLWTGTDWSLRIPEDVPPWPIRVEAMSLQIYDAGATPGYPYCGAWAEFGILLDRSTYMPIYAGYTDDAGRIRWTGQIHSHRGLLVAFGALDVTTGVIVRYQAQYMEEVAR